MERSDKDSLCLQRTILFTSPSTVFWEIFSQIPNQNCCGLEMWVCELFPFVQLHCNIKDLERVWLPAQSKENALSATASVWEWCWCHLKAVFGKRALNQRTMTTQGRHNSCTVHHNDTEYIQFSTKDMCSVCFLRDNERFN